MKLNPIELLNSNPLKIQFSPIALFLKTWSIKILKKTLHAGNLIILIKYYTILYLLQSYKRFTSGYKN